MISPTLRSLRRNPLFAVTATLTLALAIAMVTAVFSLAQGVLFRPLPFRNADRLVVLGQAGSSGNVTGVSYPNFQDWRERAPHDVIRGVAYARGRRTTMHGAVSQSLLIAFVTPGFFDVMQPSMLLGSPAATGAVLSYRAWVDDFHRDPAVVGKPITVDEGVFTVVGVLTNDVVVPEWAEAYLPIDAIASDAVLHARDFHADSRVVARLADGVSLARANAALGSIAASLVSAYPAENRDWPRVTILTLRSELFGTAPSRIGMLAVAVVLVLLIVWVNLTNLALVRASVRRREFAVRASLGASSSRIVLEWFRETAWIGVAAGILGIALSTWVVGIARAVGGGTPRDSQVGIRLPAIGVALLIALVSVIVTGIPAAWRLVRGGLSTALRDGGGAGVSRSQHRLRASLVALEIAFALMLAIGAGLLVKSFWRLLQVDPGFDTHHLVAIDFSPPGGIGREPAQVAEFYRRMLESAQHLPGVRAAALSNHLPLNGAALPTSVTIEGRVADPAHDPPVLFRTISPEYLGTMHIALREGRDFTNADLSGSTSVLVNQAFVRAYLANRPILGQGVLLHKSAQGFSDLGEPLPSSIIGVVTDVHHFGLGSPPVPEIYLPYTRNPWSHMVLVVRAAGAPGALIPSLRRAMLDVDPTVNVSGGVFGGFAIVDDLRDGDVSGQRFNALLLGGFGACAALLSAIGIYGLMAYAASERRQEMAIRMALGARAGQLVRMMVISGGTWIAAGLSGGIVGAALLTRTMSALLFAVQPVDVGVFAAVVMLLGAIAVLACYLPSRRASRSDPVDVLRR